MVSFMTRWKEKPDWDVILGIQQGDRTALEVLYDRYSGLVYKLSLRILANPEAAADLTQEIFLAVWSQPEKYQVDRASIAVFLSVMTRSKALNRLRSLKSHQQLVQRFGRMERPDSGNNPNLDRATLEELPASTYFLEKGDFFRINNLTVGYTLPTTLLSKVKIQSLRAYVTVQNLATITKYSGFSPEINNGSVLAGGIEQSIYPTTRTFAFGVNVGF